MTCELPEMLAVHEIRKSRKSHRCCECQRDLPPGSAYRRTCGVWDGQFEVFTQCPACAAIWDWAYRSVARHPWDGPVFTQLRDYAPDMYGPDGTPVTPMMIGKLVEEPTC